MLSRCLFFVLPATAAAASQLYAVDSAEVSVSEHGALLAAGLGLHISAPRSAERFPVIWFVTGGGGIAPVSAYSLLLSQIVARGYIVVGLSHGIFPPFDYPKYGKAFYDIMQWGKDHLASQMASQRFSAVPDVVNRSAVMGQSAGNHVVGQGLTDGCSVAKAFVLIDAVDGFDPYRIVRSEDLIKPGGKVNFSTPALLLNNGLDPLSVNRFTPPCAPASVSNDHFYNAWAGPIWNINATKFGHLDCMDDPSGLVGVTCPSDPSTDKAMYRAMLADAVTIFLGALFNGRPNDFALLENTAHWKIDVVLKHDLKGLGHRDIVPACANLNYQTSVLI
mmetsp:Transcript_46147/g.133739  ORF Transcript_46147/g.133739 Transcript_46147/m.133739 type:complete len:334 (+) Transcript_46147:46-1047(+)